MINLHERMLPIRRDRNCNLLITSRMRIQLSHRVRLKLLISVPFNFSSAMLLRCPYKVPSYYTTMPQVILLRAGRIILILMRTILALLLNVGHNAKDFFFFCFFLFWVLRPFQEYFTYIEPIVHRRWAKTGVPGEKPPDHP